MLRRYTKYVLFGMLTKHNDPTVNFEQMKVVEYGGSGPYKAIAVREKSLTNYVVYRPVNMDNAVTRNKGKLPVLVFANGGCMDTSIGYENMLTDIASYGYVVVAIGELQMFAQHDKDQHTPSSMVAKALDWISKQTTTPESPYYDKIDEAKIAAAGHSCGGAQVLANAANPRLKTYLILNAGMGNMKMADASPKSLKNLHGPILYLVGGTTDVVRTPAILEEASKGLPSAYVKQFNKARHCENLQHLSSDVCQHQTSTLCSTLLFQLEQSTKSQTTDIIQFFTIQFYRPVGFIHQRFEVLDKL